MYEYETEEDRIWKRIIELKDQSMDNDQIEIVLMMDGCDQSTIRFILTLCQNMNYDEIQMDGG
jgi:hypothetical protein